MTGTKETKKIKARRNPKAPCSECGFEDTTARCVFCGKPICACCAMPSFDGDEAIGPAMVTWEGRRGRVCAGYHSEQQSLAVHLWDERRKKAEERRKKAEGR